MYLSEFPSYTDGPAETIVTNDQRFNSPADKMSKGKDIKMAHDTVPCDHRTIHSIFLGREVYREAMIKNINGHV